MGSPAPQAQPANATTVSVVQASVAAFTQAAITLKNFNKRATADRLNASGLKREYNVGDLVMIYFPPSADEARRRGRKVKHLCWYRGPLTVVSRTGTLYRLQHNTTGKVYERTIRNVATFIGNAAPQHTPAARPAAAPAARTNKSPSIARCDASTNAFGIGDFIAVLDDATGSDRYYIQQVIDVTDSAVTGHIYGSFNPSLGLARFKPIYVNRRNQKTTRPPPGTLASESRWTDTIKAASIPDAVIGHRLVMNKNGQLSAASVAAMSQLTGTATLASLHN